MNQIFSLCWFWIFREQSSQAILQALRDETLNDPRERIEIAQSHAFYRPSLLGQPWPVCIANGSGHEGVSKIYITNCYMNIVNQTILVLCWIRYIHNIMKAFILLISALLPSILNIGWLKVKQADLVGFSLLYVCSSKLSYIYVHIEVQVSNNANHISTKELRELMLIRLNTS